jgi:hypothetical protein
LIGVLPEPIVRHFEELLDLQWSQTTHSFSIAREPEQITSVHVLQPASKMPLSSFELPSRRSQMSLGFGIFCRRAKTLVRSPRN